MNSQVNEPDESNEPIAGCSYHNTRQLSNTPTAVRLRQWRARMTEEARAKRRSQNAAKQRSKRTRETLAETNQRRRIDAAQHLAARRRSRVQNSLQEKAEKACEDETEVTEHYCGLMSVECYECKAKHFLSETSHAKKIVDESGNLVSTKTFSKCCKNGQIKLDAFRQYPEPFLSLMKKTSHLGKNFMENIRSINSSFAFASMGANIKPPPGYGPYCFRIHGQIYHRTGTLHPPEGEIRQYAQLYILDTEQANAQRLNHSSNENIDPIIFNLISDFMEHNNPFSEAYKMLYQVEKESIAEAQENGIQVEHVTMAIVHDRKNDQRRYNAATANEVAVVFNNKDGMPPTNWDLIIHAKSAPNDGNKGMQRISLIHKNLEALTYPILFPYGDQGWGVDLLRNKTGTRNRISLMEYYSYHLSIRDSFSPLLNAGKLTQQYFVDAYVKVEANRLSYIQNNQKDWRGDTLKGLQDYVATTSDVQGKKPGKAVLLPSSFPGGPRYMQQNYQDAMSIVTKYGKPDLFVTMTCNPRWKEITENLDSHQSAEHRPDLVARVFNLKLNALLSEITNKNGGIFGKVIASIYVIEFQKRGLPHAHILLILDENSKLNTADKIDNIVRAEIPDQHRNPRLYHIVTSHMVHTPCGKDSRMPCMRDGFCSKKFPRSFQQQTLGNGNIKDGYALYKRSNGVEVEVRGKKIDNRWIVPYNPYLSLRFNCHINVEVCASIQSVKYLFKYVYKGHDCANVTITDSNVIDHNEIKNHVDSRYVSAPESAWRLFGFDMHAQSHSVERLAVHLPGEQYVVFCTNETGENHEDEEPTSLNRYVANVGSKHTTLTAWFELNRTDPQSKHYYYWEIPLHYTWLAKERKWKIREKCFNKIGRMYTVSPKDTERFYLRLILLHTKGAVSFAELLTVNGVTYQTFREAAKAGGLLIDDDVWQKTLDDAVQLQMPQQLRQIFAYICAYCAPADPKKLWFDNLEYFTDDICHKIHQKSGQCRRCEDYALRDLKQTLTLLGYNWCLLGLPNPAADLPALDDESYDSFQEQVEAERMMGSLNADQKNAFEQIVAAIDNNSIEKRHFFIDGPGGSGKTYLYRTLMHFIRGRMQSVLPAASTGIAANLLVGGRTYHSLFRLGVPITDVTTSNISYDSTEADIIRSAVLIIIDECTMASCHAVDAIDKFLKEIMNNTKPFGGKVILLGGDFRQCLAIIPHAMRAAIVQGGLKNCSTWHSFRKLSMINNMRSEDPDYSEWLLKLGNGALKNEDGLEDGIIEIPEGMVCSDSIVQSIFGSYISVDNVKSMSKRAILCPKNDSVDLINLEILTLIEGEEWVYLSCDSIADETDGSFFPVEFLNSVNVSGMPPHKLKLKIGCVIMLLRNLNTRRGLCNGTRLYVTGLKRNLIEAEVLTGSSEGNRVLIPRIDISPSDLPFKMKRRQFPVKLSFAMTINKSQGQTLDRVGIFLPEPVFGHGQLYVAFSRVRRAIDVKVKVIDTEEHGRLIPDSNRVFTKNVVFHEVFREDN